MLNPIIIRGASNLDSNSLRAGAVRSGWNVAALRGGSSPLGIGPNSSLIVLRAASGSNPPTTTRAALFGWYHLS